MEGDNSTNYAADRAAALVGMMRRPWTIENITVKNVDVWALKSEYTPFLGVMFAVTPSALNTR